MTPRPTELAGNGVYSRPRIEATLSNAACRLGYQHPTDEQREAVIHFVSGEDVFVSLPTGAECHFAMASFLLCSILRLSAELFDSLLFFPPSKSTPYTGSNPGVLCCNIDGKSFALSEHQC